MKLTTTNSALPELTIPLILEVQASGAIAASTPAFPDCRVEAATRSEAIAHLTQQLQQRLAHSELMSLTLAVPIKVESPWNELFGLYQNDPDFAEIAASLRAERDIDDDSEVDSSVYQQR